MNSTKSENTSNKNVTVSENKLNIISGDILNAPDQYIAQQCNCITNTYLGLAKSVVQKFPWADFYSNSNRKPGTIQIAGNPVLGQRQIIAMFAQYNPGRPSHFETKKIRVEWFQTCLNLISVIPNLKSIGFPFNIGCGLAGGDWEDYHQMLANFAASNPDVVINLYKL